MNAAYSKKLMYKEVILNGEWKLLHVYHLIGDSVQLEISQ